MQTIKIPFTGINRSIDEGISQDGQCMELVNARIKNGTVEPMGIPVLLGELPVKCQKLYHHPLAKRYIAITETGEVYSLNEDFTEDAALSSDLTGKVNDVQFLGNIVVFLTDSQLLYMVFEEEEYKYLGKVPELPEIKINQLLKIESITPDTKFLDGRISDWSKYDFTRTAEYNEVGYFDNCIDSLNKEGYMVGPCLMKYAFRTFSGDYINESPIFLVEHCQSEILSTERGNIELNQIFPFQSMSHDPGNATPGDYTYTFAVMGTRIVFSFPDGMDLRQWKSIIVSIDVFISPIDWYEKKDVKHDGTGMTYVKYAYYANEEKQILKAYRFYKVSEFSLTGDNTYQLDDWSKDNIALQEQLIESISNSSLTAEYAYVYNSRLHLANVRYGLFEGHSFGYDSFTQGELDAKYPMTIYTTIVSEQESVLKKSIKATRSLTPFLTYPDARATLLRVYSKYGLTAGNGFITEFPLKKHPYLNLAYYCSPTKRRISPGRDGYKINPAAYYISLEGESVEKIPEEKNVFEREENVLKVSSLNNPFSFPAAQTYQPSTGEIVGLCSNTTALSQGQFGQYPLYVFSSDGVYAMNVGTGDVVYGSQTPISRDVCTSPKSIRGIDQAVIFATKRGLAAISGSQITFLSGDMDGYLPSCVVSSPVIPKIAAVAGMEGALSAAMFNDYLENAEIGYNYQEAELYVSNPAYAYAYVYNLDNRAWSKLSPNVSAFVNTYPDCLAIRDRNVYDMQNNNRSVTRILLLSRPLKMGSNTHKRILQTALRGIVKGAMSDLYLRGEQLLYRGEELDLFSNVGFYILGSNDAEHFTLVSGKESIRDIRDLVTKMNKSKAYKYFMVALAGGVRTDVSINYAEFIADEAFGNRLR